MDDLSTIKEMKERGDLKGLAVFQYSSNRDIRRASGRAVTEINSKKLEKDELKILEDIQQKTGIIPTTPDSCCMDHDFGLSIEGTHLTKLTLHGCDLGFSIHDDMVKQICKLPYLKSLGLYQNHLTQIPDCIGDLKTLEFLSVQDNYLTSLPEGIGKLTSLKFLEIFMNKITTLPKSFGNLQSLIEFNMSGNKFTEFPEAITTLTSLIYLNLSFNYFASISQSIGNLTLLRTLNLRSLPLRTIPDSIGNLTSLETLSLAELDLECLPTSIEKLGALLHLYLVRTRLKSGWKDYLPVLKQLQKQGCCIYSQWNADDRDLRYFQ